MFLRSRASAIASASMKSFLFDFTKGFTNRAAISRASCPCCVERGQESERQIKPRISGYQWMRKWEQVTYMTLQIQGLQGHSDLI